MQKQSSEYMAYLICYIKRLFDDKDDYVFLPFLYMLQLRHLAGDSISTEEKQRLRENTHISIAFIPEDVIGLWYKASKRVHMGVIPQNWLERFDKFIGSSAPHYAPYVR